MLIASKKVSELEELKWTDKVYHGDTAKNTAALTFYARQRDMTNMAAGKGRIITVDPNVEERLFGT